MPSLNPIAAAVEFLEDAEARDLLGLHRIRVNGEMVTRGELAETLKKAQADGFVQPKITGYRQLGLVEASLMNEIKAKAEEVGKLVDKLAFIGNEADVRWVDIARDNLQQGFMALTRAVAKPTTF